MIYTFTINIKFCNVKCSLHSLLIFCVHGIIIIIVDPCGIRDKVSLTAGFVLDTAGIREEKKGDFHEKVTTIHHYTVHDIQPQLMRGQWGQTQGTGFGQLDREGS